ncbi:MAG: SpoIID/LytB domain-containing protein [Fibrobacteraceae bacterium]|nr:SpoIID/LytB domain-containing protein [Fibrobacteraceae bacterium]
MDEPENQPENQPLDESSLNFAPIEEKSTTEESVSSTPQGLVSMNIPDSLNRPIRVALFMGVKNLFLVENGDTTQLSADGFKSFTPKKIEGAKGKCIVIAETRWQLKNSCYPGSATITAKNGKLDVVNTVEVEEYLRGVVPYEMGKLDQQRFEALKAQAVAARTYAYKHFNSRGDAGFDVYADTRDQVYKGLASATPLTDEAVKQTAGVVMTYNHKFITAYYHSTCGGQTETMATWQKPDLPYLKSVSDKAEKGGNWCNESSYTKWERKFTDKEINTLFRQNASEAKVKIKDFNKVLKIEILNKLSSGRVLTMRVTTNKGSFDIWADKTRWLFKKNGSILPSSFFSITHKEGLWIVEGKGFGHGVGMCQMGVRGMAAAGKNYGEILGHYYQGITFEKYQKAGQK